jgi:hypothetical protein
MHQCISVQCRAKFTSRITTLYQLYDEQLADGIASADVVQLRKFSEKLISIEWIFHATQAMTILYYTILMTTLRSAISPGLKTQRLVPHNFHSTFSDSNKSITTSYILRYVTLHSWSYSSRRFVITPFLNHEDHAVWVVLDRLTLKVKCQDLLATRNIPEELNSQKRRT